MPKEDFKIGKKLIYIGSVDTFEGTIMGKLPSGAILVHLDEPYWIRRGKVVNRKVIVHNYELEFCTTYPQEEEKEGEDNVNK